MHITFVKMGLGGLDQTRGVQFFEGSGFRGWLVSWEGVFFVLFRARKVVLKILHDVIVKF